MTASAVSSVPGPHGRRLLGNTYDYDNDRLAFLTRCREDFGDVFRFSPTTVVVSDPEIIHDVFIRTNGDFRAEGTLFSGDRATAEAQTAETDENMLARRRSWSGVNQAAAAAHGGRFLEHLDRLVRRRAGAAVEVLPLMKEFSGVAIVDYCLGGHGDDVSDVAAVIDVSARSSVVLMGSSFSMPRWLPLPRVVRARRSEQRAIALLEQHVVRRLAVTSQPEPEDLLDVILARRDGLDTAAVVRLIDVVIRASHGVPGAALTWAVRQFALVPEQLARVRAESDAVRRARRGEAVPVSQLPYTEAFVNELLRCYPPTWLMGRWVHRDTRLAGFELRRGEQVMFSAYHVHRDLRWWDDPDEFRPERWLGRDRPYTGRAYFPFGAGPRVCFGNQLGLVQLTFAIAWLADAYDIDVVNLAEAVMQPRELLVPRGLTARFDPRS